MVCAREVKHLGQIFLLSWVALLSPPLGRVGDLHS